MWVEYFKYAICVQCNGVAEFFDVTTYEPLCSKCAKEEPCQWEINRIPKGTRR